MTGKDLFQEIGNISEEYVAEAADYKRKDRVIKIGSKSFSVNTSTLKTMSAAACLVICAGLVFTVQKLGVSNDSAMEMAQEYQNAAFTEGLKAEDAAPMEEKAVGTEAKAEEAPTAEMEAEETVKENTVDEGTESAKSEVEYGEDKKSRDEVNQELLQQEAASVDLESKMIWEKMTSYPGEYEEIVKLDDVYILVHGKAQKGQEIWDAFEKKVNSGEAAQVEIIRFTVEGDPIIATVCYDGEGFELYVDSSRDAFGSGENFEHRYETMAKKEKVLEDGGKTVEYSLVSEEREYSIVYLTK